MNEYRCPRCGRLLCKTDGTVVSVKCPRCDVVRTLKLDPERRILPPNDRRTVPLST